MRLKSCNVCYKHQHEGRALLEDVQHTQAHIVQTHGHKRTATTSLVANNQEKTTGREISKRVIHTTLHTAIC